MTYPMRKERACPREADPSFSGSAAGKKLRSILLVAEGCDMERSRSRLARYVVGMNLHLPWILGESDGDKPRFDLFVRAAPDGAGKVRLRLTLQRNLPCNDVLI